MRQSVSIVISAVASVIILTGGPLPTECPPFGPTASLAQPGWKAEYESICSKTDVAMVLSIAELKGLIVRCDKLKPQIEKEEESTRKVYLRRLQMCRDLYRFVLENKERE
jgi:hypothetical protein